MLRLKTVHGKAYGTVGHGDAAGAINAFDLEADSLKAVAPMSAVV